ncbi:MAG: antibiotic biosynthesis monooxygenase [Longimicrobiales bacterium]|nr:antibiotic biosynthesis monooxygenase [Longimicrobiales bacterium]
MISRQWRGLAKREDADRYIGHLREEIFPALRAIPGFVSASILKREADPGVEFLIVTRWASMQAVEAFAGPEPERAVVPEEAQAMMIDYDRSVRHYEVVA